MRIQFLEGWKSVWRVNKVLIEIPMKHQLPNFWGEVGIVSRLSPIIKLSDRGGLIDFVESDPQRYNTAKHFFSSHVRLLSIFVIAIYSNLLYTLTYYTGRYETAD